MRRSILAGPVLVLMDSLVLLPGCSDDSNPVPVPQPTNLPEIPVPSSTNDLLPARSPEIAIGLSNELDDFAPLVTRLQRMADNGSLAGRTRTAAWCWPVPGCWPNRVPMRRPTAPATSWPGPACCTPATGGVWSRIR